MPLMYIVASTNTPTQNLGKGIETGYWFGSGFQYGPSFFEIKSARICPDKVRIVRVE